MSLVPPPGGQASPGGTPPPPPPIVPRSGQFAMSEVLPLIQRASAEMRARRDEWQAARDKANHARAYAKKVRADLIVTLRVWGNEASNGLPIKTSVERNEWADADADVQQAELEADLAQTVQMSARAAWEEAQAYFGTLQTMLGMERDEFKHERGEQH